MDYDFNISSLRIGQLLKGGRTVYVVERARIYNRPVISLFVAVNDALIDITEEAKVVCPKLGELVSENPEARKSFWLGDSVQVSHVMSAMLAAAAQRVPDVAIKSVIGI